MQADNNKEIEQTLLSNLKYINKGGDYTGKPEYLKSTIIKDLPAGHPLATFLQENDEIVSLIDDQIVPALKIWQQDGKDEESFNRMKSGLNRLKDIKQHYVRKENSLYPLFVKHGLATEEQISRLWMVDDAAKELIIQACKMLDEKQLPDKYKIEAAIEKMRKQVFNNVFNSNVVLTPVLDIVVTVKEWYMVKQDELEMGYSFISLPENWKPSKTEIDEDSLRHDQDEELSPEIVEEFHKFLKELTKLDTKITENDILRGDEDYPIGEGNTDPSFILKDMQDTVIKMEVGSLSLKEIPAIFNVLPIDLTFVDKYDRVKWFSNSDRIFPRTRSVIGRPVIRCHPPKSIDKVLEILKNFHDGVADEEDFWVDVHGRMIYLKFYAVRDRFDNYLGCLETVQDVTKFKYLNGTKTLENKDKFDDQVK